MHLETVSLPYEQMWPNADLSISLWRLARATCRLPFPSSFPDGVLSFSGVIASQGGLGKRSLKQTTEPAAWFKPLAELGDEIKLCEFQENCGRPLGAVSYCIYIDKWLLFKGNII